MFRLEHQANAMQNLLTEVKISNRIVRSGVDIKGHVNKRSVMEGDQEVTMSNPTIYIIYVLAKTLKYSMIKFIFSLAISKLLRGF